MSRKGTQRKLLLKKMERLTRPPIVLLPPYTPAAAPQKNDATTIIFSLEMSVFDVNISTCRDLCIDLFFNIKIWTKA